MGGSFGYERKAGARALCIELASDQRPCCDLDCSGCGLRLELLHKKDTLDYKSLQMHDIGYEGNYCHKVVQNFLGRLPSPIRAIAVSIGGTLVSLN